MEINGFFSVKKALFLSLFHNNFILIGHSKQCVKSRRTRGVLKMENTSKGRLIGLVWERQAPTHGLLFSTYSCLRSYGKNGARKTFGLNCHVRYLMCIIFA